MFLIGLHICIYILQVTLDLDNETSDEMAMLTLFCPDPHSSTLIIKRATWNEKIELHQLLVIGFYFCEHGYYGLLSESMSSCYWPAAPLNHALYTTWPRPTPSFVIFGAVPNRGIFSSALSTRLFATETATQLVLHLQSRSVTTMAQNFEPETKQSSKRGRSRWSLESMTAQTGFPARRTFIYGL